MKLQAVPDGNYGNRMGCPTTTPLTAFVLTTESRPLTAIPLISRQLEFANSHQKRCRSIVKSS